MSLVPTVIEKSSNGERVYDIYSRLLKDRIIIISGEINDINSNTIVAELLYLDSLNNDDISIYINSPGGSVTAGMAIYDTMNFVKSDVSTICVGMAASMGAFLLSSGCKGKRYVLPNSEVMIHQPLGGFQGQATDIDIHARRILKIKETLTRAMAESTNGKVDYETMVKMCERDNFMSAQEAKEIGLIDDVIVRNDIKKS